MRQKLLFLAMAMTCTAYSFAQTPMLRYKKSQINPTTDPLMSVKNAAFKAQTRNSDSTQINSAFNKFFTGYDMLLANVSDEVKQFSSKKDYMKAAGASIKALKDSLDNNTDSLTRVRLEAKLKSVRLAVTARFLAPAGRTHAFKIWNIDNYDIDTLNSYLYNQGSVSAFQNVSLQKGVDDGTFINAELASFLFGPVRMGLGGSFKSSGDTGVDNAKKASIQKILYSGGSINLNFSLPLIFCRDIRDQVHFGIFATTNNGINPGINDSTGNTNFSNNITFVNQSGVSFHFDAGSNDQKASISFDIPCLYTWGSNATYSQLGIRDYAIIKLQAGVVIQNQITLHIAGPLWSSSKTIQNTPFSIALQFSPTQILGK